MMSLHDAPAERTRNVTPEGVERISDLHADVGMLQDKLAVARRSNATKLSILKYLSYICAMIFGFSLAATLASILPPGKPNFLSAQVAGIIAIFSFFVLSYLAVMFYWTDRDEAYISLSMNRISDACSKWDDLIASWDGVTASWDDMTTSTPVPRRDAASTGSASVSQGRIVETTPPPFKRDE